MYIFIILLALLTSLLWLLPNCKTSTDKNVIALKSSGAGCLSLIVLLILSGVLVSVLQPPVIMIFLVVIAFLFVPVMALLFSSFMAVKLHTWNHGTGKAPAVRAAVYFLSFVVLGLLVWGTGTFFKMREFQENWRMDYSGRSTEIKYLALEQKLLNPVFWRFSAQLVSGYADGSRKKLTLPESFNGTQLINVYELPAVKGTSPELILFADAFSIIAVAPRTMELFHIKRDKGSVHLNEKEITSWNVFDRVKYLGALRGNKFIPPEMTKETPLKTMYE